MPFNGRILAEYYGGSPGGTIFDHPDEIGSMTTSSDYKGNTINEKLFYPFGELWTGAAIPNLNMHQTFAQLPDYDSETDEYSTANRHYNPTGRWLTPDPDNAGADPDDPQTWNMYAYARNNPTTLVDPSGLLVNFNCANASDNECKQAVADINSQLSGLTVQRNDNGSLSVLNQKDVDLSKLSAGDKALFNAITDTSQTATINIVGNTGQSEFGTHDSPGLNTVDMGNLAHLGDPTNAGGLTTGGALAHEIMDAWFSLSQPSTPAGEAAADKQAGALFPGLFPPTSRDTHYDISSGFLNGQTALQHITNGVGAERVTIKYGKPVPLSLPPNQLQPAMKAAGSRVTGVTFVP